MATCAALLIVGPPECRSTNSLRLKGVVCRPRIHIRILLSAEPVFESFLSSLSLSVVAASSVPPLPLALHVALPKNCFGS